MFLALALLTGPVYGEMISYDNSWGEYPLFNVVSQTSNGIEIVFSVNELIIEESMINGVPMKTIGVPGIFLPNNEGAPNLPGIGRFIAIPRGSEAILTILDSRIETIRNIDLAPAYDIPSDTDDSPLEFNKDMSIYGRNQPYPAAIAQLSQQKKIRGVDAVILGITPFQYNPVTKDLRIYRDIRVKIEFVGGNGQFGENRLRSRFWEPILRNHLLNYQSLPVVDFYQSNGLITDTGFEYVIIVPNDAIFEAWADTIKTWRKLQGISTEVYTLTAVGGSDSLSIRNFIHNAYNNWDIPPAAFLILSDYPSSGETYGVTSPLVDHPWWGRPDFASDNWYADVDGDTLPDIHHARICAQSNSQLDIMINKFLSYERSPYVSSNFYNNPLVACGWQTTRWFQLCIEIVRGFFITGLGKSPSRHYQIYSGTPTIGGPWSSNVNTPAVVQYWYNVGWLPDTVNQQGVSWWSNGTTTGIVNDINSGAFIIQHRDHGSLTGWGEPDFHNSDLDDLTNTMYTFVNSTNCLTGEYQNTSESFTEKFHRISHGAVGVNSPTQESASFVNDVYVWGMFDLMWPQFDPGYPSPDLIGEDELRPCIAMTSAKYYLDVNGWPYNPEDKSMTYNLYHHHGDAFTTLYSRIPLTLTVSHASTLPAGQTNFAVTANDGSVIALTVSGEIIGVAEGTGGSVNVPIEPQTAGSTVLVTVTKANYYRYTAEVTVGTPGLINLKRQDIGSITDYTAIGAYKDTITCAFDYYGSTLQCRYWVSYDGGTSWLWYFFDDSTTHAESPDLTARGGGGVGVIYRYYTSPREGRFTWRDYGGGWDPPESYADNAPFYNKPSIEYLGGDYGVVYLSWNSPVYHAAYFDRSGGGGCDYVVGDVNGSDSYNGLDITYGVNYFKGGNDPFCPFGSCPIPPCNTFFYCGDVNGSCSYNGLDITYGVSYFKGGALPMPCGDCPPSGLIVTSAPGEIVKSPGILNVKPKGKEKSN